MFLGCDLCVLYVTHRIGGLEILQKRERNLKGVTHRIGGLETPVILLPRLPFSVAEVPIGVYNQGESNENDN